MIPELSSFGTHLRGCITSGFPEERFGALALELFALQFAANPSYRKLCESRGLNPANVTDWTQIPAVPAAAFKEFEMTCLTPTERTAVFHSSGTTGQVPSRHFHCVESLALYEASLWTWFAKHFQSVIPQSVIFLTPPPEQAPYSSLVHMFETVRNKMGGTFMGQADSAGAWTLDFTAALAALSPDAKLETQTPKLILGTAFSFVHLLDHLAEQDLHLRLPAGSRVMETGGYKGRSRALPRAELHALITERLGVPESHIICEYGMSELSSQAYDVADEKRNVEKRPFRFPSWVRVQIISSETGRPVGEGETGLLRIFDLANAFSVMAIQTEDLAFRRGDGFELIGRAQAAEPRGCSLMTT